MIEQEPQQGTSAPPDWKEWNDFSIKLIQDSPERLETGAKQILALITLSISIFGSIGLTAIPELPDHIEILIKAALILWLLASMAALFVILPFKYELLENNTKKIKEVILKISTRKRRFLYLSLVLFGLGLIVFVTLIILA